MCVYLCFCYQGSIRMKGVQSVRHKFLLLHFIYPSICEANICLTVLNLNSLVLHFSTFPLYGIYIYFPLLIYLFPSIFHTFFHPFGVVLELFLCVPHPCVCVFFSLLLLLQSQSPSSQNSPSRHSHATHTLRHLARLFICLPPLPSPFDSLPTLSSSCYRFLHLSHCHCLPLLTILWCSFLPLLTL